ncbi:MAG: hypothetical protein QXQ81_05310 [Candidatus Thorarchaeota archaeon]
MSGTEHGKPNVDGIVVIDRSAAVKTGLAWSALCIVIIVSYSLLIEALSIVISHALLALVTIVTSVSLGVWLVNTGEELGRLAGERIQFLDPLAARGSWPTEVRVIDKSSLDEIFVRWNQALPGLQEIRDDDWRDVAIFVTIITSLLLGLMIATVDLDGFLRRALIGVLGINCTLLFLDGFRRTKNLEAGLIDSLEYLIRSRLESLDACQVGGAPSYVVMCARHGNRLAVCDIGRLLASGQGLSAPVRISYWVGLSSRTRQRVEIEPASEVAPMVSEIARSDLFLKTGWVVSSVENVLTLSERESSLDIRDPSSYVRLPDAVSRESRLLASLVCHLISQVKSVLIQEQL